MAPFEHTSVMSAEVVDSIAPRAGGVYADATLGGAGHTRALLDASAPDGWVLAVDRDPSAVEHARTLLSSYGDRAVVVHGDYASLPQLLAEHGKPRVDGLVADLGVSSPQLDLAERGFSFGKEGPLDMRMDTSQGETAAELIQRMGDDELADVLFHYGEERRARPIARSIHQAQERGELSTTTQLRAAVVRVMGPKRSRLDPATRTFQGLRIAVNRELEQLSNLLTDLPQLLAGEGVAAIISFHSLEDRLVKRSFRDDRLLEPLTKRPRVASDEEREGNPRSRSAKLRAARRVPFGAETTTP